MQTCCTELQLQVLALNIQCVSVCVCTHVCVCSSSSPSPASRKCCQYSHSECSSSHCELLKCVPGCPHTHRFHCAGITYDCYRNSETDLYTHAVNTVTFGQSVFIISSFIQQESLAKHSSTICYIKI